MSQEYSTIDIAKYVIQYAFDDTEPVTNLALQKIDMDGWGGWLK